jgi:hypothetical protein
MLDHIVPRTDIITKADLQTPTKEASMVALQDTEIF